MDSRTRRLLDTIVNQIEVPMEEMAAELSNPSAHQIGVDSPDELEREAGARARDLRYDLSNDWPALRRVAAQAGINLEEALGVQS